MMQILNYKEPTDNYTAGRPFGYESESPAIQQRISV